MLNDPPPSFTLGQRNPRIYHQHLSDALGPVPGWACVTNQNIGSKHDERFFFSMETPQLLPISNTLRWQWKNLIQDSQDIHKKDLDKRIQRGQAPGAFLQSGPGLSRHVYTEGAENLRDRDLCYAAVESSGGGWIAKALYPIMIPRTLHPAAPIELVPPSLLPPCKLEDLSPAERVFGWVRGQGTGAYRGNLSVGEVKCLDDDAVKYHDPAIPLAILGQPKPNQARFYVAKNKGGAAQPDGLPKVDAGYDRPQIKGLRGRKVYPHHKNLPPQYWDPTQGPPPGNFHEYRRPQDKQDDQNRSIKGWVKEGKKFEFELSFTNLSKVELGALLWLINQPPGRFHRLGGGKPLGFVSVSLEIANFESRTGEQIKERYRCLDAPMASTFSDPKHFIDEYQDAVKNSYGAGDPFDQVPFIAAIYRAMEGFNDGLPIHYPRARQLSRAPNEPVPPHPDGLGYEWFVANELERMGPRLCLHDLATDPGLPFLQNRQR
jgi:CRISPR-associated protein (TIGR03986 family)